MGLLDKLWDVTVAGPQPESELAKLRKKNALAFTSNTASKDSNEVSGNERSTLFDEGSGAVDTPVRVTRSITIVRPAGYSQSPGSSPMASPAGGTPPVSPFSGNRSGAFRFRRRSTSDAYEKTANEVGPQSPFPPSDV